MASLPKKVFEHFSRGIIHKNEIYVYLFMTFTIFPLPYLFHSIHIGS
jgi:nitrate reductase NapE component